MPDNERAEGFNGGTGLQEPAKVWEKAKKEDTVLLSGKSGIAPVTTTVRNGMVHQYSTYHIQCTKCGRNVTCRSDDIPRKYEDYQGRRYCRSCFEKLEKTESKPCEKCGTPVTLYDRRVYGKKGMCDSCWLIHMSERRKIFARYDNLLLEYLKGLGISAKGTDTYGLEESGQPSDYRSKEARDHDMIRLRQNEYVIGAFHIDNGWIAIPECGSGLRYITPASSAKLMTIMASVRESVLAAAVSEKNVYVLDDNGMITSNDNEVNGRSCFGKAEMLEQIAKEYFTEEELDKAVSGFMSGGIQPVVSNIYYDTGHRVFFSVAVDGNYYHGYDVDYYVRHREDAVGGLLRLPSLADLETTMKEKRIPLALIAARLEEADEPGYQPPDNFGYGTHFI